MAERQRFIPRKVTRADLGFATFLQSGFCYFVFAPPLRPSPLFAPTSISVLLRWCTNAVVLIIVLIDTSLSVPLPATSCIPIKSQYYHCSGALTIQPALRQYRGLFSYSCYPKISIVFSPRPPSLTNVLPLSQHSFQKPTRTRRE